MLSSYIMCGGVSVAEGIYILLGFWPTSKEGTDRDHENWTIQREGLLQELKEKWHHGDNIWKWPRYGYGGTPGIEIPKADG